MKKLSFYFLLTYLSVQQAGAAPAVSGHIDAPAAVKQLVVYLEPDDSKMKLNQAQKTAVVSQLDTEFHPPLIAIAAGDKVQWTNDELKDIDHNIFSLSPLTSFDLGLGEKGSKLEHVFKNTGVINYYCSVHKNMEGKIIILPNRYYQLLDRPGDFSIDNVPEGNWILNAVVLHLRYKAEPVKLTVGKAPVTDLTLRIVKK
ncbi:MAG: cupredoxin domain-containing protein [Methylobacter sp.]